MKKLSDYLPKAVEAETKLVQAKIPASLHAKVRTQMAHDKSNDLPIDWNILVEAACQQYLDERKKHGSGS